MTEYKCALTYPDGRHTQLTIKTNDQAITEYQQIQNATDLALHNA